MLQRWETKRRTSGPERKEMRIARMEGQWGRRGKELEARSRDAGLYPMQEKGIVSERDWMRTKQVNQSR